MVSAAISFEPNRPGLDEILNARAGSACLKGWELVSLNGAIVPMRYVGWYKVDHDCTSTMPLLDDMRNPVSYTEAFILDDAKAIDVVNLDQGCLLAFPAVLVDDHHDWR
ncbi:MAG: hypothetical protein ABSH28_04895 [Acidobacteriota bacterium]